MRLFHRKASYREQRAVLPATLYGPEPTVAPASEVIEASRHNAGHSSGWHPEDAPYLTPGALQHSPMQTTLRLPAAERDMPMMQSDDPPTEMGMTRSPRSRREVAQSPPTSPRLPVVTPQVSLTAWPATRLAPRHALNSFPQKGDLSR
jgi:hypothetical protein